MIPLITRIAALFGVSLSPIVAGAIMVMAILGGAGLYTLKVYEAGRVSAEGECQAAALQSKIDAMVKDRDDARRAAADASLKLAAIEAETKEEQERTAEYVEDLKTRPAPSCALTCDDLRGMRIASRSCPADPRPAASSRTVRARGAASHRPQ